MTVDSARQCKRIVGSGSPDGVVSANRGSLFQRRDGGIGNTLYTKGSLNDEYGWVPVGGLASTATANETTPTVFEMSTLKFGANTTATAVTALEDGAADQAIRLICTSDTNSVTIADGGNFRLSGSWAPGVNDTLSLYTISGTIWVETARSNN